jgi:hypothetical protein
MNLTAEALSAHVLLHDFVTVIVRFLFLQKKEKRGIFYLRLRNATAATATMTMMTAAAATA